MALEGKPNEAQVFELFSLSTRDAKFLSSLACDDGSYNEVNARCTMDSNEAQSEVKYSGCDL